MGENGEVPLDKKRLRELIDEHDRAEADENWDLTAHALGHAQLILQDNWHEVAEAVLEVDALKREMRSLERRLSALMQTPYQRIAMP